jgi:hypothetical protein
MGAAAMPAAGGESRVATHVNGAATAMKSPAMRAATAMKTAAPRRGDAGREE